MAVAKEQSNASVVRVEMTMKGRNFRRDETSGELVVSDGMDFEGSFDVQSVNGRTAVVDNVDALFGAFRRNVAEMIQSAAAAVSVANDDVAADVYEARLEDCQDTVREGLSNEDREVFDAWFSADRDQLWPLSTDFAEEFGLTMKELRQRVARWEAAIDAEAAASTESDAASA